MRTLDLEYFARRRQESLARANAAADPAIAKLHRQFASHYDRRIAESAAVVRPESHAPNA